MLGQPTTCIPHAAVPSTTGSRLRLSRVKRAFGGALAALASDLPAAVLADFLGIHVSTAVRWVNYARQDWTAYLAARDADHRSSPGRQKEPSEQDTSA